MSIEQVPIEVPSEMSSGPVSLQYVRFVTPEGHVELAPYYHFFIVDKSDNIVGHINLRIGESRHILSVAGHIGYQVHPEYRGHNYSYHACKALAPFIHKHYTSVVVTADVDNLPSNAVIRKIGAEFIDRVEIPEGDPGYKEPGQVRLRYKWHVNTGGVE